MSARTTRPVFPSPNNPASPWQNIDLLLAAGYAVIHLVFSSTLLASFAPGLFRLPLMAMPVIILATAVISFLKGNVGVALLAATAWLLLAIQLYVFSATTLTPINWNLAFSYLSIAGFVVFYNARHHLALVLRVLFWAVLVYCAIYCLFSGSIATAAMSADLGNGGPKVLGGDDRGPRLGLAIGHVVFAFFYAVVNLRYSSGKLFWLFAVALTGYAMYLSMSRLIGVLVLFILALYLFGLVGRKVRILLAVGFVAIVFANMFGALSLDWNFFAALSGDDSGAARANSYQALRPLLSSSYFFGLGIASDSGALRALVGSDYVFWEDLGPFGVWVAFGMTGAVAFIFIACLCILGVRRPSGLSATSHRALLLAALPLGLYAVLSPSVFMGTGTIVSHVVLAVWLASGTDNAAMSIAAARLSSGPTTR